MANDYYSLANALGQNYLQNSIFPTIGDSISGAQFYDNNQSPYTNLAINIAKGLFGGALTGYGQAQANNFRNDALVALPALASGRSYTNDSLGESDLALLKNTASALVAQRAQDRQDLLDKINLEAVGAGLKKKFEVIGENQGYGAEGALENPNSGPYKVSQDKLKNDLEQKKFITDLEDKTQKRITQEDPSAVAAGQMFPAFETLQKLIDAPQSPATDLAVKASIARILDPVGAVGKDSTDLAAKAQPLWDQAIGNWGALVGKDGQFTPDGIKSVTRALSSRVEPIAAQYDSLVKNQSEVLKSRGGSPTVLTPIPYKPYVETAPPPPVDITPQAYRDQLAASGKSPDEARALLLQKFPSLGGK